MDITEFKAKVKEKKNLVEPIREIIFELIEPAEIEFQPGQFININIPGQDKPTDRSYSIASPASSKKEITLCYKLLDEGVATNYLESLSAGDEITFTGPRGHFVCRESDAPLYMVVTGTGVTPILSMLTNCKDRKAHLLFGVRSEKDIFWEEKLKALQIDNPQLTYEYTLSQPTESWTGSKGRVTAILGERDLDKSAHYYLCGSPKMVLATRKVLVDGGVPASQVFFEIFT